MEKSKLLTVYILDLPITQCLVSFSWCQSGTTGVPVVPPPAGQVPMDVKGNLFNLENKHFEAKNGGRFRFRQ